MGKFSKRISLAEALELWLAALPGTVDEGDQLEMYAALVEAARDSDIAGRTKYYEESLPGMLPLEPAKFELDRASVLDWIATAPAVATSAPVVAGARVGATEAAKILGCGRATVYRWATEGKIPPADAAGEWLESELRAIAARL